MEKNPLPFLKNGVAQVALVVKDLDATVKAWYDNFGIGPWKFYTYGKPLCSGMTRNGKPAEYRMRLALANAGPMRIELIEPLEGDTVYSDFVRDHGYGIHHLGLLSDDIEADLRLAEDHGFAMTMDGSGFGPDGDGRYAYLDTESVLGTTLELIDRPARRREPEKVYPPESD